MSLLQKLWTVVRTSVIQLWSAILLSVEETLTPETVPCFIWTLQRYQEGTIRLIVITGHHFCFFTILIEMGKGPE